MNLPVQHVDHIEEARFVWKMKTKSLRSFYWFGLLIVISSTGLSIYSSLQLANKYSYYSGIQYVVIVAAILSALTYLSSPIIFSSKNPKTITGNLFQIIGAFTLVLAITMGVVSIILSVLSIECGYYIGHDQPADGLYIKSYMDTNPLVPTCTEMQNNVSGLTMQNQIQAWSVLIIIDYCDLMQSGSQTCMSMGSLLVENWSSMFLLQIVAAVVGFVGFFCVVVPLGLLTQRYNKAINDARNRLQAGLMQNDYNYYPPYTGAINSQGPYLEDQQQTKKPGY